MTNTSSSLYGDDAVASGYLQLIRLEYTASQIPSEDTKAVDTPVSVALAAWESFYGSLVSQIYSSLGRGSHGGLPPLHLHTAIDQRDLLGQLMSDMVRADPQGVHVGLGFVTSLDTDILLLSDYLMENFLFQIAPPAGESPSLPKIISVEDFSSEALSFYSANLIPGAESRDGYRKRPFQFLMETL